MTEEHGRDGEAGFVLPCVLAILIVVCALLAATVMRVRSGTALTQARADLTRVQGLADGIARLVAYDLGLQRTYRLRGLQLPEDGRPIACDLAPRERLLIALQDQGLLVDLNATPRAGLETALRGAGIPDATALALAAEIVDYRDADDVPEPSGGAEAPQYRARGLGYGPRNAPFVSVDEIGRLPSMTEDIAARLKPLLTIYNESGRVAGASPDPAKAARGQGARTPQAPPAPSPRQYFRIDVLVEEQGVRAGRSGTYALGGGSSGMDFLAWQPGIPTLPPALEGHPTCGVIGAALQAR
ncbi:type II secretion system protein GspK [Methylobacterium sp. WL8]|uniref:general secretion pathway protein GspK n=1 Tax=Methylobacterium sp. WL8 TaxID=2603899 RepID=UPI001FEF2539|nr:type II secretion system protein GspK [Methylobacterium sp. WL8]